MRIFRNTLTFILGILFTAAIAFSMSISVYAAEGEDGMQFGRLEEYSTFQPGNMLKDDYYYDDEWFSEDSSQRNDALALLSMQLTATALEYDQEGLCVEFLENLGFSNIQSKSLDPAGDDFGYTYGIKKVGRDILAAIVVHSYAFDKATKKNAWIQNFTINGEGVTSGEQYAYKKAVEAFDVNRLRQEMTAVAGGNRSRFKFWIMGQSRGGAMANLTAIKLRESGNSREDVFAYTFESPAMVEADAIDQAKDYSYIHNYICDDDLVTMIPPWDMVRYGQIHVLGDLLKENGISTGQVNEELKKLGSMAQIGEGSGETINVSDLIHKLEGRIPSREAYSKTQTDTFEAMNGSGEVSVEYNYQRFFQKLMGTLFGEEGFSTEGIPDHLMDIVACFDSFVRGYMIEAGEIPATEYKPEAYYWDCAGNVYEILDSVDGETGNLPLDKEDVYVLLKLAAPIAIEPKVKEMEGYEITSETLPLDVLIVYINPLLSTVGGKDDLIKSHQFDTLLARLNCLAPAPALDDLDITIPEPAAGESNLRTPGKLAVAVDGLDRSWMDVSSSWDSEDKNLQKNKEYYLNVEWEVVGHSIPADLKLTINKKEPVGPRKISYENGVTIIRDTWKFTIGNPSEYTVSFDNQGHGTKPDSITVNRGDMLSHLSLPDLGTDGKYRFTGWKDEEGRTQEEITVDGDVTLYANWSKFIDEVKISFTIPKAGQKTWKEPQLPQDADYYLDDAYLTDEHYETITGIIPKDEMLLIVKIHPKDDADFLTMTDEDGFEDYAGKVIINGEELEAYYEPDEKYLSFEYRFLPEEQDSQEAEEETTDKGITATEMDKYLCGLNSDTGFKGSSYLPLMLKSARQTRTSVKLSWKKMKGAVKYVVYGNLSGKNHKFKKIKTVKKNTFTVKKIGRKLKKGKYYKFVLVALDKDDKVLSASAITHAATKGSNKAGNYKSVKIKAKKTGEKYKTRKTISLKAGEKARIKATGVKASRKTKVKTILKMRYVSSRPEVAQVTARGVIKAKGKGSCIIYAYAQNGISKGLKIKVK